MIGKDGAEIVFFETPKAWEQWLEKHHATTAAVWVQFFKKASGVASLNYDQALDEALCFGWIDGVVNKYDENSYLQRFTPRRPKGNWSKRNTEHIARLTAAGKMRPSGLKEIEHAKADGRWQAAYDSSAHATIPEDFLQEIEKNKNAYAFFQTLSKANLYAIYYRLQTAKKKETIEKRKKDILAMLKKGETFH